MGDGGGAKKVAAGFPVEVAVHEDVVEGKATTAVGAGGIVTRSRLEVVRVIGVKRMAHNELEAHGLKGTGLGKENALGKGGKHRGWVVVKGGVKATWVMALKMGAVRGPFKEDVFLGGKRRGPVERELGRMFPKGV